MVPPLTKLSHDYRDRRWTRRMAWSCAILAVISCAALASCAVGPDYHPPEPPVPGSFAATGSLKTLNRSPETAQWWRTLRDRELNSLVERALAASPTLEIALDRVQQARAQEAVVVGAALPAAGASAGGGWGSGSDLARGRVSQTLVSAENGAGNAQVANIIGFDAAWEIDIFGKFRRAIEAAQYDVEAATAARDLVLISLIADVTHAYLDLRALQMNSPSCTKTSRWRRNISTTCRSASSAVSPTNST